MIDLMVTGAYRHDTIDIEKVRTIAGHLPKYL